MKIIQDFMKFLSVNQTLLISSPEMWANVVMFICLCMCMCMCVCL